MRNLYVLIIAVILSLPNIAECAGIFHTLKSGDVIGILAPSTYAESSDLYGGIEALKAKGYRVKVAPSATAMYEHFAGTDRRRAEDINDMFRDDSVKAIICVRGGYGAARTLGMLDYDMIARHPKPFIGFSDITALHIALAKKANIPTIHGAMLVSFTTERFMSDYTSGNFFAGLTNPNPIGEIPMPEGYKLETVTPGRAEGVIIGGNLTVLTSLVGTPYELDGNGAILFLEEIGEKPYRVDRMLNQLYQNGLLRRVRGILLGDFVGCEDEDADGINDFTLDDVLRHYARISRRPVIKGVPAGHGKYNMFLPFGVHAVMNASDDGSASLVIDGSPFVK
ncbi:MAG: LD-carboxypeptidase [Synergistaceae bacterium]|nr:LD-carboxypeptidase [Synergistaceae bacterium]